MSVHDKKTVKDVLDKYTELGSMKKVIEALRDKYDVTTIKNILKFEGQHKSRVGGSQKHL